MKIFIGRRHFLKNSESTSRKIWLKVGQKSRAFWAFFAKMLGKKVERFASSRSFEKEMRHREGIFFLCFCVFVFFLSVTMMLFCLLQYQQKEKDLEKLQRYIGHLKEDNLLLMALSEEEKRNNQLSLAVDYGYAFSQDLVVALKYPEVPSGENFYFWQLFLRHWQYLMMLAAVVVVLFFHKYLIFFVDVDRQELALQRLSHVFPSLVYEKNPSLPEQKKYHEIKNPLKKEYFSETIGGKNQEKSNFFAWSKKWMPFREFFGQRQKAKNNAKTSYFRYFRSHFYQHKKSG